MDAPAPQKSNQINKKVRPLDSFVIKIKRNTMANCNLMRLDVETIKRIMKFLTLTDNARLSRVCNFLYHCFKGLWFNSDFFSEMDLSKFSGVLYDLQRLRSGRSSKNLNCHITRQYWAIFFQEGI